MEEEHREFSFRAAGLSVARVLLLVFDADHKKFLCFDCLERFINEHYPKRDDWDNDDDDDY